jgi:D-sedoheptulose 7-phosphate isomerase
MSLKKNAENYFVNLSDKLGKVKVTNFEQSLGVFDSIEYVGRLAISQSKTGKKIIFIGNGASASIASHMSTDFWKNGGMRAVAFNDAALLTCLSNDCGYENVFGKSVDMFADEGDILFAISSSGKSENILNGVKAARNQGAKVITFSGFNSENPLRQMGDINFYVPDCGYGVVEILHLAICHCILDVTIMEKDISGS